MKIKKLLTHQFLIHDRKKIVDLLGTAGSNYRNKIYDNSFSGIKSAIGIKEINGIYTTSSKIYRSFY